MEFQSTDRGIKRVFTPMDEDANEDNDGGGPAKKRNVSLNGIGMCGFITDSSANITPFQVPNAVNNSASNQLQNPSMISFLDQSSQQQQYQQHASHYQFFQQRQFNQQQQSVIGSYINTGGNTTERNQQNMFRNLPPTAEQENLSYKPTLSEQQNPYYYESNKMLFELYAARVRRSNQ